jgi:hypothetical protein
VDWAANKWKERSKEETAASLRPAARIFLATGEKEVVMD